MAVGASGFGVSPLERELALRVVIELRRLPVRFCMAGATLGTKAVLVNILDGVACVAIRSNAFIGFAQVTRGTGNRLVCATQRKSCTRMVEGDCVAPARVAMAGLAFLSQVALVWFVFLVASGTRERGFGKTLLLGVTAGTRHVLMCAGEPEVGCPVIEQWFVQLHHVEVSALVIVVA